jgi:hypothetical protein
VEPLHNMKKDMAPLTSISLPIPRHGAPCSHVNKLEVTWETAGSGVLPVPSGTRASGSGKCEAGGPRRGHQSPGHESGRVALNVQQKHYRELSEEESNNN